MGTHQPPNEPDNAFEEIAPALPSASYSTRPCDVFINHRGSDVKRTLASSIYHTLDGMGFRVFLDVEALEPGDVIPAELQHAITSASLHIAIFSPNYSQSPWCLAELSFMLKTGTKIIPIFHYVEPSDLRWIIEGKGKYADAFSQHQQKNRYPLEKLEEWKRALHNVSFRSGYMVNNEDEDEGRVLKNVVNCVLKIMKRVPLEVAKYPVGMDEFVQDFERTVLESAQSHQNVTIVGIVGMGGSGKTTLAKELFNRKCSSIDRCSFIFEVRNAAAKNALQNKQEKLLKDLGGNNFTLDNIEQGKGILANRLRSVQVLIVLDDVDHIDQLDALLPDINSFGSDSLVIITTREVGVLRSWGVSSIYKMPGLNKIHAKQLFCWHSFLQPSPLDGFEDEIEKFLNACNGLPLSLKVLGGQLYGKKSKEYWESQLNKISRILPADIKQRLQVSYDALDEEEQEIFLDVACFFIGEATNVAIAVWDGSGWSGLHSLETLVNKCLVELDEENRIGMHDHLRDMGREIANRHSPCRFWLPEQIPNILKYSKETMLIRGINALNYQYGDSRLPLQICVKQFMGNSRKRSKRLGLEILAVSHNQFTEDISLLSQDLVWLRWTDFWHKRDLPSWLAMRNLRVLELLNAFHVEKLWEDNTDPPLQLRELTVTRSYKFQRFPSSIGRLKHLKNIILENGFRGSSLPEEFCSLQSLECLELPRSEMLSSLPAHFGDLTNLRHLDLNHCQRLETLPISFKNLIHLQNLQLSECNKLTLRLDMLENITKLETLGLSGCVRLEELPHGITNQSSLTELTMDDTSLRDVPINIGQLSKLKKLRIGSPLFKSFPPSVGNMLCLTALKIINCQNLYYLPKTVWQLTNLEFLLLCNCPIREMNFGASLLCRSHYKLRYIKLEGTQVSTISIYQGCFPNVENLILWRNDNLVEIKSLPTSVINIELLNCKMLKNIRCISGLLHLQKLEISNCPEIDELPKFAGLASIKEFEMRGPSKAEKAEGLEHSTSLERLKAITCWKVPGIQSLEQADKLRTLELTCDTISALKPCILSIKKPPRKMMISGRVVRWVKPILNSSPFPDLLVKDLNVFLNRNATEKEKEKFVQNYSNETFLLYEEGCHGSLVRLGMFRQVSFLFENEKLFKGSGDEFQRYRGRAFNTATGIVVIGEGGRVFEAFHQILALIE